MGLVERQGQYSVSLVAQCSSVQFAHRIFSTYQRINVLPAASPAPEQANARPIHVAGRRIISCSGTDGSISLVHLREEKA